MKADILKECLPKQSLLIIKSIGLRKLYEKRLIQRYVDELSCDEIADIENKEVKTIRNEESKARNMFEKFTDGM